MSSYAWLPFFLLFYPRLKLADFLVSREAPEQLLQDSDDDIGLPLLHERSSAVFQIRQKGAVEGVRFGPIAQCALQKSLASLSSSAVSKSGGVFRLQADDFAVIGHGRLQVAQMRLRAAPVEIGVGIGGVEAKRLRVVGNGWFVVLPSEMNPRTLNEQSRLCPIQPDAFVEIRQGAVEIALGGVSLPAIIKDLGIAWSARDRL